MCETNRPSHCRLRKRDRRADRPHEEASRKAIRRVRRQIAFDFLSRELSRQWAYANDNSASLSPPENAYGRDVPSRDSSRHRRRRPAARRQSKLPREGAHAGHRTALPQTRSGGALPQGDLDHWLLACSRTSTAEQPAVMPPSRKPPLIDNQCSSIIVYRDAS